MNLPPPKNQQKGLGAVQMRENLEADGIINIWAQDLLPPESFVPP